jgi:hypothetical protein
MTTFSLRFNFLAFISIVSLITAVPAEAKRHSKYVAFEVTHTDDYNQGSAEAAINNLGEIVYISFTPFTVETFSTRRGQISFSGTNNSRFPDINDEGEVVYTDISGGFGWRVISNVRGDVTEGFGARINAYGDVGITRQDSILIHYGNGSEAQVATGGWEARIHHLSDNGELYFSKRTEEVFVPQLYVASVGSITKLTNFAGDGGDDFVSYAANNKGEFVYARNGKLYGSNGKLLWRGTILGVSDMNDHGDITVNIGRWFIGPDGVTYGSVDVVLLTKRPHVFKKEFKRYRPERE